MGNRENILECALHLFYKKGYDAVGVQEIAETAGITKPTMYYYFKSKSGLLEVLLRERCEPLNENIRQAVQNPSDVKDVLVRITKVYLSAASVNREFYFLMISLFYAARESEAHKMTEPYLTEQFEIITHVFDSFSYYLGNMNGRQRQFSVGFIGLINNYILVYYQRTDDGEQLKNEELAYALVHQFMHGIFS